MGLGGEERREGREGENRGETITDILVTGAEAVTPIGECLFIGILESPGIDEAILKHRSKASTFLNCEACCFFLHCVVLEIKKRKESVSLGER